MNASEPVGSTPGPGLRERKKLRTRQAIQEHALRLFAGQGYDETTVEQIAAAAEVSPSTFFRYFPTKEDVVLQDDWDPVWRAGVLARPADEPPLQAALGAITDLGSPFLADNAGEMLERLNLVLAVPALRARTVQNTEQTTAMLAGALAERAGRAEPDYADKVNAAVCIGVATVAVMEWAAAGGTGDLLEMLRSGFAVLGVHA